MADQDENWSQEATSLEEGEFLQDQIWCERKSKLLCQVHRPNYKTLLIIKLSVRKF